MHLDILSPVRLTKNHPEVFIFSHLYANDRIDSYFIGSKLLLAQKVVLARVKSFFIPPFGTVADIIIAYAPKSICIQ